MLTVAAWVGVGLGAAALVYAHLQIQRGRELTFEQLRPHVVMYMEPHAADWHIIELVVRNFGQTAAHDIAFRFPNPPTVARYEENRYNGYPELVELQLPDELPILAPGQEWRTVWDSAIEREELGGSIRSRFDGLLTYYDRPRPSGRWNARRARRMLQSRVVLDWATLQPVQRLELMTNHDLARREKQKLELLRSLLTYYHYASKETRPDVYRAEIDRINRAVRETQDRWRTRQHDETTVLDFPWIERQAEVGGGRHHRG